MNQTKKLETRSVGQTSAVKDRPAVVMTPASANALYHIDEPAALLNLADELKKFITERKLTTPIQGKDYVQVEGWQYLGSCLGVMPVVEKVINLSTETEIKYESTVLLKRIANDQVIGRGVAVCSNREAKRRNSDEYVVMSMSETRAIGKAFRNNFAWIIKAAGYEATPAEEMDGVFEPDRPVTPRSTARRPGVDAGGIHRPAARRGHGAAAVDAAPSITKSVPQGPATTKQLDLLKKLLNSHVFDVNYDAKAKEVTRQINVGTLRADDASAFIDRLLDNRETGASGVVSLRKDLEEKAKTSEAQITGEDRAVYKQLFYEVWNTKTYEKAMDFLLERIIIT